VNQTPVAHSVTPYVNTSTGSIVLGKSSGAQCSHTPVNAPSAASALAAQGIRSATGTPMSVDQKTAVYQEICRTDLKEHPSASMERAVLRMRPKDEAIPDCKHIVIDTISGSELVVTMVLIFEVRRHLLSL